MVEHQNPRRTRLRTPEAVAEADSEIIREAMVNAMKLKVVEMGWGKNWQEVK